MTENAEKQPEERVKKQKKETEEKLPFCTSAPSAVHARGMEEEEPCEDSRSGDYGEDTSTK